MDDEPITLEEWRQAGADQWRDKLLSAWGEDYVSLSAVVWWIATGGEPRDCDDDELENAAKTLLRQARSKEYPLSVKGRRSSVFLRESVPRDDLSDAMPFFGIDERMFFSGVPCVQWNSMLEDGRDDVIQDKSGARTWCDLSIEREDMLQLWPVKQGEVVFPTESHTAIAAVDYPEDALAPYKTGTQGRPSPIQFVEREAERRRKSGEALERVSEEADYLHNWCTREHPKVTAPTPKTIENKVRANHRNWKATR